MKCHIEYVGKLRNGVPQFYCVTHKSLASDKKGNKLEECLSSDKNLFENKFNIKNNVINDLRIVYPNILESTKAEVFINGRKFEGVFLYEDSVLNYKDLSGMLLSRLNCITLEVVKCNHCGKYHTDNGKFAYTPHRTHLCLYCGHLFRVNEKNIGNEFSFIFDVPNMILNNKTIIIDKRCTIEYDLLTGVLLVNEENVNKILLGNKEIEVRDFLNDKLKEEF